MTIEEINSGEIVSNIFEDGYWYICFRHNNINYNMQIDLLIDAKEEDLLDSIFRKLELTDLIIPVITPTTTIEETKTLVLNNKVPTKKTIR